MSNLLAALAATACLAIALGIAGLTFVLVTQQAAERPTLGNRGVKRAEGLRAGGPFALVEPLVRYIAAWFADSSFRYLRARLSRVLVQSGDHLGLSDDELLAMSVLSGGSLSALVILLAGWMDFPFVFAGIAFVLGALAPPLRVRSVARERAKCVTRSLPRVIELAAMCMGAGLDFPSSLRRIVESAADRGEPIIEELRRVLQEIDLGRTRRSAMADLADRVPSDDVRELVNSVTQAEDKGSPLARVLTIQAKTLRLRRSIAAEETASEAALMLVGPMTLIFLCVIVLLLGPVAVRFMTGGLGPA